jgi:formylglycine-generating enzyme required for sulfatase activity
MRRIEVFVCWTAVLIGSAVSLWAQASPPREVRKRAIIITNTAYKNLPPISLDASGPEALAEVLGDAQFAFSVEHDLNVESLNQALEEFQSNVHPGDISFLYYSGYMKQEGKRNYLLPVDFDPTSNIEIYYSAYDLSRFQDGLAKNKPFLSMLTLDASWDPRELSGQAGFTQPDLLSDTWMFAAVGPGQTTTDDQIRSGKVGFFTSALVKVLPRHGQDLTELVSAVKAEVEEVSKGAQRPYLWSTFGSKFYFHAPDPSGERVNSKDRLPYVYIPAGRFWMGCVPASGAQCNPNEKPRHRVEITKGFWLGQTEVTNLAYNERFAKATKTPPKKANGHITNRKQGDLPVVGVSWAEAQKYCQWVAVGGRLPTEAEWERAARGGNEDDVYPYPDLSTSRNYANFMGRSGNDVFEDLAPVKQFNPNHYNLFDMAGNVWEWVFDWFGAGYYGESSMTRWNWRLWAREPPIHDPQGPAQADNGKWHVARGGSWFSDAKKYLRISYRQPFNSGGNEVGFRCVVPDTSDAMKSFVN